VTDLAPIAGKLANFIRLLASDKDGEVVAAWRAIIRTLQGTGADIHDIADRIEHSGNGALAEHEMREIFDAGIREGVRQVEQKIRANQLQRIVPQFPPAADMALYCYQRINNLNDWEQEFATNMVNLTRRQYPLSIKQQARLEELYIKLGGRI
jgi:DNA-binding transcriptional MerR regulator